MDLTKIIPSLSVNLDEHSLKALVEDTFKDHIPGYKVSGVYFSVDHDHNMMGEICGSRVKANVKFSKAVLEKIPTPPAGEMGEQTGSISDGYHTFDELYEHRHSLMLALMRCLPYCSWLSRCHDDGSSFDGWFICGIDLPQGNNTVTYHLPERLWESAVATGAKKLDVAPKWDGHTPDDVIKRLLRFAT